VHLAPVQEEGYGHGRMVRIVDRAHLARSRRPAKW
jgi:hypothetical protein